jgi:hypothetical protein
MMRGCDIDTGGKLWAYKPVKHKTQHHGHERVIYFCPKAQEIVRKFLKPNVHAFLFSPADADQARRQKRHDQRETPIDQGNAPGTNRKARPRRQPGGRYTVNAYRKAIVHGCELAFNMPDELHEPRGKEARETAAKLSPDVQKQRRDQRRKARSEWRAKHVWHPNQLRHTAATRLRRDFGLETAQVILGHKRLEVTQVYAEKNIEAARRIMGEVGQSLPHQKSLGC